MYLKPILFCKYKKKIKYYLTITYEDETTKDIEVIQNDKTKPYKFIFKKDGNLNTVIGVPTFYEISNNNKFTDINNQILDGQDILISVDCSDKYESTTAKFYLKDLRDIVDMSKETPNPEDDMQFIPSTQLYHIYLNNNSCDNIIECEVDPDNLEINLMTEITKMGDTLNPDQYSDFNVLYLIPRNIMPLKDTNVYEITEPNKITITLLDKDMIGVEFTIAVKYFVKELNKSVFEEFIILPKYKDIQEDEPTILPLK